ncbi:MAG: hypothetical protein JXQ72_14155 [Anaerolineae bacterium]|nr:hypothetical protein [Anaerolineae bacterium]
MSDTKRKYEPPMIMDMSIPRAKGEGPLGTCTVGTFPFINCVTGENYGPADEGSCYPAGSLPAGAGSNCTTGTLPSFGSQCSPWGSSASSDCSGGWRA